MNPAQLVKYKERVRDAQLVDELYRKESLEFAKAAEWFKSKWGYGYKHVIDELEKERVRG